MWLVPLDDAGPRLFFGRLKLEQHFPGRSQQTATTQKNNNSLVITP